MARLAQARCGATLALAICLGATACDSPASVNVGVEPERLVASANVAGTVREPVAGPAAAPVGTAHGSRAQGRATVLLGGDVSFGRSIGQRISKDPGFDPFAALEPWFRATDARIVNLESILSDQGGSTEHPENPLVFSGPPAAAGSLRRARIDIVSAANNHSWDYGKRGLSESLALLERANIEAVGASTIAGRQFEPVVIERSGLRLAVLAFTQVWNDGELAHHPAREHVAGPDYERMKQALRKARQRADFVIASLHASNEYVSLPRERARRFAHALLISGADVVFGHHPHVLQGVEWIGDKPVLYSLGNLVFESRQDRPETRSGALAVLEIARVLGGVELTRLDLCPVMLEQGIPRPAPQEPFASEFVRLSKSLGGFESRDPSTAGCLGVGPPALPVPYAKRRGFAPDVENGTSGLLRGSASVPASATP